MYTVTSIRDPMEHPEVTEEMLYEEYLKRKETSPSLVYEIPGPWTTMDRP